MTADDAIGAPERTVAAVLAEMRRRLAAAGVETPDLDARLLVAGAMGLDAAGLLLRAPEPVTKPAADLVGAMIARRLSGEPVHRILGRRAFYAHDFALSADTLEPRPDTEALVDLCRPAIEAAIAGTGRCLLCDIGTGTGAIAVSLLALYPRLLCVATDVSQGAVAMARANAESAGVSARFLPMVGDYLAALAGPFDMLVSNPPYIPSAEIAALSLEVRGFDPMRALDGGADGLDAYRAIAGAAGALLAPGGQVLVEIGQGQASDVADLFREGGLVLAASADDLSGTTRALQFERPA